MRHGFPAATRVILRGNLTIAPARLISGVDFGVFEVGMNRSGEIDYLSKIIKPNVGVITNISYAHVKKFKNLKQIALAKSEIMNNIVSGGSIVLNADDQFFNLHKKLL